VLPATSLARAAAVQLRIADIQYPVAVGSVRVWTERPPRVEINERQVVPSPALPLPSKENLEARPADATYRLGVQEFTVSATQPVDRPMTRMDAGFCARNLPSTWERA